MALVLFQCLLYQEASGLAAGGEAGDQAEQRYGRQLTQESREAQRGQACAAASLLLPATGALKARLRPRKGAPKSSKG